MLLGKLVCVSRGPLLPFVEDGCKVRCELVGEKKKKKKLADIQPRFIYSSDFHLAAPPSKQINRCPQLAARGLPMHPPAALLGSLLLMSLLNKTPETHPLSTLSHHRPCRRLLYHEA